MENNIPKLENNYKSKPKRKYSLGLLIVLASVVLVAAAYIAVTVSFDKELHIWSTGSGSQDESVAIITGDIGNSDISCESGDTTCSTGDITVQRKGDSTVTCQVTTTSDPEGVTSSYTGEISQTGAIVLDTNDPKTFQISYEPSTVGDYTVHTDIVCSAP